MGPTLPLGVFDSIIQQDFPYKRPMKSAFWGGYSNNILDSQAKAFSKVRRSDNKDEL